MLGGRSKEAYMLFAGNMTPNNVNHGWLFAVSCDSCTCRNKCRTVTQVPPNYFFLSLSLYE